MKNQTENPKKEQAENPNKEQTLKPKKVWIEPELKQIVVYGGDTPAYIELTSGTIS